MPADPSSAAPLNPMPRVPDRAPAFTVPRGACDTHLHVFGDPAKYPLAPRRHYTPALNLLADYRRTAAALGIERAVLVQPSVYGFDNRAMQDALAEGAMDARGVAVVGPDIADAQLDRMHALGVRGVRANVVNANGLGADDALRLAPRLKARGWHLQLQVEIERFDGLDEFVARAGLPVVIDHFGLPSSGDPDAPAFARLRRLVARGACWVKLSGNYRFPAIDVTPLARALAEANPQRLLWASDWPHPGLGGVAMPDDVRLLEQVGEWFQEAWVRGRVLAENAAELYWN